MGQYFRGIVLGKNKKTVLKGVSPYEYGNGAKLMEHSYIGNNYVKAFETLITNKPQHVVWCGDYADKDIGTEEKGTNAYERLTEKKEVKPFVPKETGNFVVNHTKKQYVDKTKVSSNDGWQIHPLPLLTCNSNGRGGGDFGGNDPKGLVGSWAKDLISIETEKPTGFTELKFNLKE
jgi:hypothetical protein